MWGGADGDNIADEQTELLMARKLCSFAGKKNKKSEQVQNTWQTSRRRQRRHADDDFRGKKKRVWGKMKK